MGDSQVTLLIGFFMLISYIWAKIPYGMTAVFCCLALEITGVLSSAEAWAGFGNTTVFLFASIFILGAGLMKTSFIIKIQKLLQKIGSSEKKMRWICMYIASFLAMLTSATAAGATMLPMVSLLSRKGNFQKRRLLKPVMDAACMGFAIMPFGMGAAFMEQGNSYLQMMGSSVRMSLFDSAIARLPVLIVTISFIGLFGYKFISNQKENGDKNQEEIILNENCNLSEFKDKMGIGIFFGSIAAMIISSLVGIPSHYAPLIGALLMIVSGVLSGKEAFGAIDLNTVCIFAGSLGFANALTKTGIADWIVEKLVFATNSSQSEYVLVAIFLLVPFAMTQFMGNIPVINLTMPIAATVACTTGINPTAIMVATVAGATLSISTPMAAGIQALIMEAGEYRFSDYIKAGLPTAAVFAAAYIIWAPFVFPLY